MDRFLNRKRQHGQNSLAQLYQSQRQDGDDDTALAETAESEFQAALEEEASNAVVDKAAVTATTEEEEKTPEEH